MSSTVMVPKIFAVCLILIGQALALPLGAEVASADRQEANSGRLFLVKLLAEPRLRDDVLAEKVAETQKPEQPVPPQKPEAPQFPWPYPPIFESVLPDWAKKQLVELYEDQTLSAEERSSRINAVFDSLPQDVIESLPLPVEYERLPFDVYKRLHYIHVAPGFKWAERQALTQTIVESLPEAERQLMSTPRFGGPPPGFEHVLSPTIYKQLLFVHYNPRLTREQRADLITRVMRQVPPEQISRLPLPMGMDRLPAELQQRARALVYDYSVPQPVRAQRVRAFVDSLPAEIRPILRR